jgi:hypothetical protein
VLSLMCMGLCIHPPNVTQRMQFVSVLSPGNDSIRHRVTHFCMMCEGLTLYGPQSSDGVALGSAIIGTYPIYAAESLL